MNPCSRTILTIGMVVSLALGWYPRNDIAWSAVPPSVNSLPDITSAGIATPARLATDSSGNIYVTDPGSGGVLKYDNNGNFKQKFITPKSGVGVAIAQSGELLVTQGTTVIRINTSNGSSVALPYTFQYANAITVNPKNGDIYVSDSKANVIRRFNGSYSEAVGSPSASSFGTVNLTRPTGLAYDRFNDQLYIANSLGGSVAAQYYPIIILNADLSFNATVAGPTLGYDTTHVAGATKFNYPQGIALEYHSSDQGATIDRLERIYVVDAFHSIVQVLDGTSKLWLYDIGRLAFPKALLWQLSDVVVDQYGYNNRRLFVANGSGNLTVFGLDNIQATDLQVINPTLSSLTLTWTNPPVSTGYTDNEIYWSTTPGVTGSLLTTVPAGTASYEVTPLGSGNTYYYTLKALAGAASTPYTQQVSGKTRVNYTLDLYTNSGTGSGNVSGPPSCSGASCTGNLVLDNTTVTLTAVPSTNSVFSGWKGYCDPALNDPAVTVIGDMCSFVMTANRIVTAEFALSTNYFKVDGMYFGNLHEAVNSAGSGSLVQIMAGTYPANTIGAMTGTTTNPVKLQGGYDAQFTAATAGQTVISGRVNVQAGKITVIGPVRIKP